jgi:hypothetical protein
VPFKIKRGVLGGFLYKFSNVLKKLSHFFKKPKRYPLLTLLKSKGYLLKSKGYLLKSKGYLLKSKGYLLKSKGYLLAKK